MSKTSSHSPWPLLAKELVELAARKRTYAVRVAYAGILFLIFWVVYKEMVWNHYDARAVVSILGAGDELFNSMITINFSAIYLMLPAMMAGVITFEKERDSLHLLIVTDLRPWEIILQKYFSRLLPMFTFILLSLPLMALAFSFGGISARRILTGSLYLMLGCLQVGAYALMISSFCRTTSRALVSCYLGYFGIAALLIILESNNIDSEWLGYFFALYWYVESGISHGGGVILLIAIASACLLFARIFLIQRAFQSSSNLVKQQCAKLDRRLTRVNESVVGGIMFGNKQNESLPDMDPVAWREKSRRSLGSLRHIVRTIMLVWIPVLLVIFGIIGAKGDLHASLQGQNVEDLTMLLMFMWPIALLLILVSGVKLIASERTAESLDILAATPISGRDIVLQKMAGLRVFMGVLMGAFIMVFLAEGWLEHLGLGRQYVDVIGFLVYLLFSTLTVLVYFPMFAWLAMWCGLKYDKRIKATMLALLYALIWIVLPVVVNLLADILGIWGVENHFMMCFALAISPALMFVVTELELSSFISTDGDILLLLIGVIHFVLHCGVLLVLRSICLSRSEGYIGRAFHN